MTFTANVSINSPAAGILTGTVTFMDGSTVLGTVKFDSKGDVQGGGIYVYQAKGNAMVVLKQVSG